MKFWRRLFHYLDPGPEVAKPTSRALPPESEELRKEAQRVRNDIRELRRFEIIVRRR